MSVYALQSVAGLGVFCALAWLVSENRRAFPWRLVAVGLLLQFALALFLLKVPVARSVLFALNGVVEALSEATQAGTALVFGYMGGGPAPFDVTAPEHAFILGFQALPLVLVISALSALFWHWRILAWVTRGFAWALEKTMRLGGAVGFGTAANVFLGMVEAPLLIRPYFEKLTRSELFMLMSVGLATVAGTVIVLYAAIVGPVIEGALGQIITASLISLPAAILMAQIMVPGDEVTETGRVEADLGYHSAMDAVTQGTAQGLALLLNIIAMLLVLTALVALVNIVLGTLPDVGSGPLTLQRMLGWIFAPLVWLMGVPAGESLTAGQLMGTKTILNEFLAYLEFARLPEEALSPRADMIMLYAMCGFANLGSVGIMIGGLTTLVPSRRQEIIGLSMKALVAGTLATSMTGAVIGILN